MMDLPQLLVTGSVQKVRLGVIHRTGLSVFLAACLTPAILETSSSTSGVWPGKTRGATGCHREKRAGGLGLGLGLLSPAPALANVLTLTQPLEGSSCRRDPEL